VPPAGAPVVNLRAMAEDDLVLVARWLHQPHVARWWSEPDADLAAMGRCLRGEADPGTRLLVVTAGGRPVGWAQWYRWDDDAGEAAAMGARPGEVGLDYAIGEPSATGRGWGRRMIAALVGEVRRELPGAGFLVGPDARNRPSRAVLERHGFVLVAVRPVVTEPTDDPVALYRLAPGREPAPGPSRRALSR
jgi:aminoglycoside 6'-N-acetyltransferase